jgi:hypothetical protein
MFEEMLTHLTDTSESLKEEVNRVNAALVIRNPDAVSGAIEGLLGTMYDIIQDQKTIAQLTAPISDPYATDEDDLLLPESPFDEPLAFLSLARSIVPHSMLRSAAVLLFILHSSINFRDSNRLEETALLSRVDETLGSFGLGSAVSLVQLWEQTGEYEDQRQRLWTSVVTLLLVIGEQCTLPHSSTAPISPTHQ